MPTHRDFDGDPRSPCSCGSIRQRISFAGHEDHPEWGGPITCRDCGKDLGHGDEAGDPGDQGEPGMHRALADIEADIERGRKLLEYGVLEREALQAACPHTDPTQDVMISTASYITPVNSPTEKVLERRTYKLTKCTNCGKQMDFVLAETLVI